jgi:hypothetical protein
MVAHPIGLALEGARSLFPPSLPLSLSLSLSRARAHVLSHALSVSVPAPPDPPSEAAVLANSSLAVPCGAIGIWSSSRSGPERRSCTVQPSLRLATSRLARPAASRPRPARHVSMWPVDLAACFSACFSACSSQGLPAGWLSGLADDCLPCLHACLGQHLQTSLLTNVQTIEQTSLWTCLAQSNAIARRALFRRRRRQ